MVAGDGEGISFLSEQEEEGDYACPDCGAPLAETVTVCPNCGAEFEDEEEEEVGDEGEEGFECPDCGKLLGADDTVCSNCGAEFEEDEEEEE